MGVRYTVSKLLPIQKSMTDIMLTSRARAHSLERLKASSQCRSTCVEQYGVNGEQTPFTFAGHCEDEVIFTFNKWDKTLFVSRNFLSLVSPVFRTMFTSDYKEKGTDVVEMMDKDYENVFEFLLILHPCEQKSVSGKYL